ncbi:MAG: hypothetical protein FRX48_02485 [Lasallia pustulata]|uniref:Uncharacterized protein n=1 Tax=Lasallia pustulata TaxID=136370 RepID=A0A5M8PWS0_9LECA|nr:MAG: hypothetical protein FRX48_02485 [Lasallia pustulata]
MSPQPSLEDETLSSPFTFRARPKSLPSYRSSKALPYELREHCIIYFEEALYCQALTLLISLLTSGNSSNQISAAFVPPTQHLALAATLALHPSLTTRARSADRLQAANLALRYLRLVHQHVGPINANFHEAFAFTSAGTSSRRGGSARRRTGDDASPVAQDAENVNTELANVESVWARAEDFWHVVGWAFNCSVLHKRRWERWRVWLEYMVQVLEDDWNLRRNMAHTDKVDGGEDPREGSLIVAYLGADGSRTGKERRVVRAIFADGSPRALTEFKEIWRHEPLSLKKDDATTKKLETKVNIDADIYGDYLHDDSSSDLEGPGSPTTSSAAGPSSVPSAPPPSAQPSAAPPPTLLSYPSLKHFAPSAASSLTQFILRSLISSSAPLPAKDDLTLEVLEQSYLPYAANTSSVADNAKVSLCVEALLRLWDEYSRLVWSGDLHEAVEAGILAREGKAKRNGRGRGRKGGSGRRAKGWGLGLGEEDRVWLQGSAERMRRLVEMVRVRG